MFELVFLHDMLCKNVVEMTKNALDSLSALCMLTPVVVEMANDSVAPVIIEAFFPNAECEAEIDEVAAPIIVEAFFLIIECEMERVPVIVDALFPIEIAESAAPVIADCFFPIVEPAIGNAADSSVAPVVAETAVPIVDPAAASAADESAAVHVNEDYKYAAIRIEFADIRSWITAYLHKAEDDTESETEAETELEIESELEIEIESEIDAADETAEPMKIAEVSCATEVFIPTKTAMTTANEADECCSCTLTRASGTMLKYASDAKLSPHDAAILHDVFTIKKKLFCCAREQRGVCDLLRAACAYDQSIQYRSFMVYVTKSCLQECGGTEDDAFELVLDCISKRLSRS